MIDTQTSQSPGWWLHRLSRKLASRQARLEMLDRYYRGDPPLPKVVEAARQSYQDLQRQSRTNFAKLIVEVVRHQLVVTGMRTAAAGDENGDREAHRIWHANGMDVEAAEVHRAMLSMGDGYVIVGGPDPEIGAPVITAEDPRQVVTAHDPRRQRRRLAGLKMFHDDVAGRDLAYLYLPGGVRVAYREVRRAANLAVRFNASSWEWDEGLSGDFPPGLEDVVPIVRFRNERGAGEIEDHLDHLNRINRNTFNRDTIALMQAFRQRGIKGIPLYDDDGEPIDYEEMFAADPAALWLLPETAEMWESGQVDLTPLLTAERDDVKNLAAVTFTPLYYFHPDAAGQTAMGAAAMREGRVMKARDRIGRVKIGWSDVMSIVFRMAGDVERAERDRIEVLLDPADRYSLAERADAASKAQDVPWRTRMTDIWQFTPEQVDRMETERAADALLGSLASEPAG